MPTSLVTFRHIRLILSTIFFLVSFLFIAIAPVEAAAVSCPATDGGAGDDDATADGTITINTNKTWSATTGYSADGDYWDCTGNDLLITGNSTLTFEGDTANGYHPFLKVDNLQIDSGSTLSSDEKGCAGDENDGQGPNTGTNICGNGQSGYGQGQNSGGHGGGGGGYGGEGGEGTTKEEGVFYGDATTPTFFGSSGGGVATTTGHGGNGGGVVHLELTGTLTQNGKITANGGDGNYVATGRVSGGGSGGSIYIVTAGIAGSGTFESKGGDGADGTAEDGGGGSGGRIAITYTSSTFSFDSSDFDVAGGSGPDLAEDGTKGTVFLEETDANIVNIYHGFAYDDTDYSETSWTIDSTATNQHCLSGTATPSISAGTLVLAGTIDCEAAVTSFNFSATSSFAIATGTTLTIADSGADVDFTIPASNDQTWTNVTFNGGAEGSFTINDAISIDLAGTTAINSNVDWTNLTGLTIGSSASITADGMGCQALTSGNYNGSGPNPTACAQDGSGFGDGQNSTLGGQGGSHGGQGGAGEGLSSGGTVYGDPLAPTLLGASGGSNGNTDVGGAGGGAVRLGLASGTFTHNGTIRAHGSAGVNDAGTGARAAGGGAGGSIYVTALTIDGSTGVFQANGGNGVDDSSEDGGGGGGGRIAITYTGGTFAFDSSDFSVNGGTAGVNATPGSKGTVYTKNTTTDSVAIFHGFGYDDTDHTVTGSWTLDTSATNQYCFSGTATPSITAATLTIGGTINCQASITSFNFSASSDFVVSSGTSITVNDSGSTVDFNIPASDSQTWTNVTFVGANQGSFTINDAIPLELAGSTSITANVNWSALTSFTTGSSTVVNADGLGCEWSATSNYNGFGPNPTACAQDGSGFGDGQNTSSAGGGGGAYGGAGGKGDSTTDLAGGTPYGDPTAPTLYGASGGGTNGDSKGGSGGGTVRINVAGTTTHNGALRSSGVTGADTGSTGRAGGGGAGGSVYLTTQSLDGSTGTFVANGGAGFNDSTADGGGGGGGRIAVTYTGGTFSLDSSDFTVTGGSGPDGADDGALGTVYTRNTTTDSVAVYHGFSYDDTDHSITGSWTIDASATNQYCLSGATTPSVTADSITFNATLNCSEALTSFNWSASTAMSFTSGSSMTISGKGTDVDFDLPSDTAFENFTFVGGEQGSLTIDDAVAITLASSTSITANVNWTGLSGFTMDSGTTISANALGCTPDGTGNGYGPDGSNVCTVATAGYGAGSTFTNYGAGGGGHGGAGGAGTDGVASATHGSSTAPVLFGASGGDANNNDAAGGAGGGAVRIQVTTGNFVHNGAISADATAGSHNGAGRAGGGGAGGSIYLSAQCDYSGSTGTLSADGGDGADGPSSDDGGGGGGGRVRVGYGTNSSSFLGSLSASGVAAGGTGPDTADDGADGTLSIADAFGPCVSSSTTGDADTDGEIDQIILTMTEDVDAGTVAGSDFGVTGYTVSSASRTDTSEITVVLAESGSVDTDATPALTISGSIDDTSANSTTSGSSNPTDGVAPVLVSQAYKDTDGNGQVDRFDLTFSETVGLDECEAGDYTVAGADAGSIAVASCATSGADLRLTVSNAPANDTSLTITVAYTQSNGTVDSIDDASGNATSTISASSLSDAAAPILVSQSYKDTNTDGQVDRADLTFSETIAYDECEAGDFSFGGADAGSIAVASCATSGADLQLSLSNTPADDTALTLTIGYLQAGGTGNSLDDASANAVVDILATSLSDAAAPVALSITPSNGAVDQLGNVSIVATFSEAIDTGSAAYSLSETPSDSAVAWSSGDTVLTLTTTAGYTAGAEITFTMTAAPDTAANALGGSATTAFTILAVSGGSVTGTVTILSPNGGEVLTVGDASTIRWTWTGGTANSRTQLWLSVDAGLSYALVDDFYANGTGEYAWDIPDIETESGLIKVVRAESSFVTQDVSNQVFSIQAVEEASSSVEEEVVVETPVDTEEVDQARILFEDVYVQDGELVIPDEARSPYSGFVESVNQNLEIGDLITSYSYPAVYYIDEDGTRRPFVNEETFFTYFDSFEDVQIVTDATLAVFDLGMPMLPKSGVVLVKLQSDPRVYAVDSTEDGDASLRWVPSEEIAQELYGDTWSEYVLDLPVFLFPRFVSGNHMTGVEQVELESMKQREKLYAREKTKHAV